MNTAPSDERAYADEFPPVDASHGEFSQHAGVEFFDNFHDWVDDVRGGNLRARRHLWLDGLDSPPLDSPLLDSPLLESPQLRGAA